MIFFQWIMILLQFPEVIYAGEPVENYDSQSPQKKTALTSL